MLTLDRHAVADALPFDQLIDAIESAFRSGARVPDRTHYDVEVPGSADATLLMMPAWRPGQSLGVKVATIFPDNARRSLPSVNATYLLCDAQTGQPRAILDGMELTVRRTAAASALASRYLSRSDASTLLMVGTGKLAPSLIAAHASVRNLSRVLVWGRRRQAAEDVRTGLAAATFSVTVVDDLESAVRQADIVSCATLATEPLIRGAWLREGQHIDLVGAFRPDMREADGKALAKADVYVDTRAGALAEAGEIIQAIANGDLQEGEIIGDLFDLTRGTCRKRESARAITLFKSVGTALEDLAAAELAIQCCA
jgi:ornithine cyclodeaminase/alanine dehydrogenase-like protein (mu-crystallin family)